MESDAQPASDPKWIFWTGWILTILPAPVLLFSGVMKIVQPEGMDKAFMELGWDMKLALGLGIVELGCTLIYLFPRTAMLGAILLTGYFGGAIATHVRIDDPFFKNMLGPLVLGIMVWCGLYLRDPRLRALVPWRNCSCPPAK